jgi:hypothetical protein
MHTGFLVGKHIGAYRLAVSASPSECYDGWLASFPGRRYSDELSCNHPEGGQTSQYKSVPADARKLLPQRTWGNPPEDVRYRDGLVRRLVSPFKLCRMNLSYTAVQRRRKNSHVRNWTRKASERQAWRMQGLDLRIFALFDAERFHGIDGSSAARRHKTSQRGRNRKQQCHAYKN